MIVVSIDVSNAFQTNAISDPNKRVYITFPTMYLKWFRERFPNHPLEKYKNIKELVMQSLRNIQGTKDVGFEWYQLLEKIFTDLGWKPNTTCKDVCVYLKNNQTAYLILATDNILYMSKHEEPLQELLDKFGDFFSFKIKRGIEL